MFYMPVNSRRNLFLSNKPKTNLLSKFTMIYTVTLNPAVDRIMEIPDFSVGLTYIARKSQVHYAGKGINVSQTLSELGCSQEILALIGENEIYSYSSGLKKFTKTFIPVVGNTRNHITINDSKNHTETHLQDAGFTVTSDYVEQLTEILENKIKRNDWIVLSGSLPPGVSDEIYAKFINLISQKQGISALDTSGKALECSVSSKPDLVRINLGTLGEIVERDFDHVDDIINAACFLLEKGVKKIVITLGKDGAIGVSSNEVFHAEINSEFMSGSYTSGCGDAFMAGLVSELSEKHPFARALHFATACGMANTFIPIAGHLTRRDIDKCMDFISIRKFA